jgi:4-amino-4-deoxy-L-arabinose transferase-like glycosyltransferase
VPTKQAHAAYLLIPILLLALALRLAPWGQNRFLEDEALYAYWGLQIASGADNMLDLEPVDKPPLYPYVLALSTWLLGPGETAARLPSLLASVTSVALTYALAQALYRDVRVGLLAALFLALSPFDILFASTAFTDPLMTALVLAALLAAARGHLGAAGILSGLAAATKQQGLFFLPLVVAVGWLSSTSRLPKSLRLRKSAVERRAVLRSPWLHFALGFAVVVAGVIWWDLAREQRPGFLEQSLLSYGGLGPAQPLSLGERAAGWLELVASFWVSPWYGALLLGLLAVWFAGSRFTERISGPQKTDLALLVFVLGFLALHWLVGFQIWDRYLLGLVPLAALLAARAVVAVGDAIRIPARRKVYILGISLIVVAMLAHPVWLATQSQLPLGGDHGAYDGVEDLAAFVRAKAPPGSVLYHHWLGYHYRFYLHGAPLRQHWYPDVGDLARDATVYRREPRYIAFPSWRDGDPAAIALAEAGVHLVPVLETARRDGSVSFELFRMEGP